MAVPSDRRYARTHAWALRDGDGDVRVGVTRVPGAYLGEAVYVELPPMDAEVGAGEPVGLIESSSAVCEVVAPVSGTVVRVNPAAEQSPETITADPFGEGWLLILHPSAPAELDALLTSEEYDRLTEEG
ncbi:MAG: glycine cleavage system protein H [Deltaproteobacteria bacterium]|nr:glycine cleavage system protein GcvH [Candidatus Deferrimicrobiaceae bacterium]